MKIKTITLHCTDNCGSTLQAMALQKYLEKCGHDVEIIDYAPSYLKYNGSFIKSVAKTILFAKESFNQKKKNRDFAKKYLRITKEHYENYKMLKKNPPKADAFITGSDQIWNLSYRCGADEAYYLSFVDSNIPKYAYAASVGKSEVSQNERKWINDRVNDFAGISVREESTFRWIKMGKRCPVDYVCDPVFLLDKEDYCKIEKKPQNLGNYILVYLVQPSAVLDELLFELKKKYNAKIVLIYGVKENCQCDLHIRDVSPDEFLGYIHHARFIVASSFHATAFSHIFNKNFAIVLPKANTARIEQFLKVTGLQNRIVSNHEGIDRVLDDIEYQSVNVKLLDFITHSKEVLNGYCMEKKSYDM